MKRMGKSALTVFAILLTGAFAAASPAEPMLPVDEDAAPAAAWLQVAPERDLTDDTTELQDGKDKVTAEVLVLHATNEGKGVDPEIGNMPALSEPPFSSYDTYKLLSRDRMPLTKDDAATKTLPNERVLGITFKGMAPKQEGSERERYVVKTSIRKPGGNSFLPLLEVNAPAGKYFFVAGQTHKDGILVIGIKIVE